MPYQASAERLWRNDALYDLVAVLDYNIAPRAKRRGSAIFMHVARKSFAPTAGCIAMTRANFIRLLASMKAGASIAVGRNASPHVVKKFLPYCHCFGVAAPSAPATPKQSHLQARDCFGLPPSQ
jgi:hypothetical protein